MVECPIKSTCLADNDCEENLCELGEHLADWGILCDDNCMLYDDPCEGITSGYIKDLTNCVMNTNEMKVARAIKDIMGDKSPQDLSDWTGISLDKAIKFYSLLVTV